MVSSKLFYSFFETCITNESRYTSNQDYVSPYISESEFQNFVDFIVHTDKPSKVVTSSIPLFDSSINFNPHTLPSHAELIVQNPIVPDELFHVRKKFKNSPDPRENVRKKMIELLEKAYTLTFKNQNSSTAQKLHYSNFKDIHTLEDCMNFQVLTAAGKYEYPFAHWLMCYSLLRKSI